eukprot:5335717-Amphidinium_carterae.2
MTRQNAVVPAARLDQIRQIRHFRHLSAFLGNRHFSSHRFLVFCLTHSRRHRRWLVKFVGGRSIGTFAPRFKPRLGV